jgi:FkbM family methyltransferase
MYELLSAVWQTPKGHPATFFYRASTNDWNSVSSTMAPHDEYGTAGLELSGLALDIGGYLGSVAIGLALDNPDLSVICVEPVPDNAALIRRNVDINNLGHRIAVIEGAAGHSGDDIVVRWAFTHDENALHHAFVGNAWRDSPKPEEAHSEIVVQAKSLDDLAARTPIAFLKIDCEGGEYDFLDTDVSQLARIHGEWHPTPKWGAGGKAEIIRLLSPTHDLTFSGPEAGPGGFTAIRRA